MLNIFQFSIRTLATKPSLLCLGLFCFVSFLGFSQDLINADKAFKKALDLRFKKPDSAIALFKDSYHAYILQKDTVKAINSLLEKAYVFENTARYASSYDALWTALILNDNREDNKLKSIIYNRIGRIYSYNKREKLSIEYLKKSIELQKIIVKTSNLNKSSLVPYYYSLAKTHRELGHRETASLYLDSCYLFFSKNIDILPLAHLEYRNKAYLDFEKAVLLAENDKNEAAIEFMDIIYPWFKTNEPTYLVLFYKYLGDMHLNLSQLNKSEDYYRKSIKVSKDKKSHVDFTPLVYEKLTELYIKKNDFKSAFENLKMAKELDANFFDGRSSRNQSLLEIKDNYRIEKERQEKQIQVQYLKQLEQEEKITNLKLIILLGSILFLSIIGFAYFRHLRITHSIEKELIKRKKALEIKKQQELIELKNKELAVSALQLIEKDKFLKDLKSKISEGSDRIKIREINKVLRTVSSSSNSNWEKFKLRFIDVNKEFYNRIFKKYPNLSQGDQKICALIKLNFSSKDMAGLLGISVESVHTSRHRIRKKMDLDRSVNLEDFINSL